MDRFWKITLLLHFFLFSYSQEFESSQLRRLRLWEITASVRGLTLSTPEMQTLFRSQIIYENAKDTIAEFEVGWEIYKDYSNLCQIIWGVN